MAITFPNLLDLPIEGVNAARTLLSQRLQEKSPTADFRRGVLHDLVLQLESVVHAGQEIYADKFRKAGSISAIEADPSLADEDLVDAVLSNFLIARREGSASYGEITVVISAQTPTVIGAGAAFVAFGKTYRTTTTYSAKISPGSVISATDRLILSLGDGTFGFNINVQAVDAGGDTSLRQGDRLAMSAPVPGFLYASVSVDFTQGTDTETNSELIDRLREGVASRNFSNKYSLTSLVKASYSSVKDIACIGYGDSEQIRYHGLFPLAHGGRVDAYIRNSGLPSKKNIDIIATLIEHQLTGSVWQVSLDRSVAPGFYEATRIVREEDKNNLSIVNGYETVQIIRGYDLSDDGTGFSPEIESNVESAFSPFQTVTLQFLDTDTDASLELGEKAGYRLTLRYQQGLDALQIFLGGREVRPSGSDVLVKAAIPLDVRLSVTIHNRDKNYTVPANTVRDAVYNYVDNLGFSSVLYESNLIAVIQNQLTPDQSVESIDLRGRLLYPNGRVRYINGRTMLKVPDDASNMVSPKTVSYFLDKADIEITVQSV